MQFRISFRSKLIPGVLVMMMLFIILWGCAPSTEIVPVNQSEGQGELQGTDSLPTPEQAAIQSAAAESPVPTQTPQLDADIKPSLGLESSLPEGLKANTIELGKIKGSVPLSGVVYGENQIVLDLNGTACQPEMDPCVTEIEIANSENVQFDFDTVQSSSGGIEKVIIDFNPTGKFTFDLELRRQGDSYPITITGYPSEAKETRIFQATFFEDLNRDGELSPGEQVLRGIEVCFPALGDRCVKSDSSGMVTSPGVIPIPIDFKVVGGISPIDGSPFKYVIINNGWIEIPQYEGDVYWSSIGKAYSVPTQRVADISIHDFGRVTTDLSGVSQVGIAQSPFIFNESAPIEGGCHVGVFFDLDPRKGYALDWRGNTYNTDGWLRPDQKNVISDGHQGMDCDAPMGTLVRSVGEGKVVFSGQLFPDYPEIVGVTVQHQVGTKIHEFHYGHLDGTAVKEGETVYPNQIIGFNGMTGTRFSVPHIHINYIFHDEVGVSGEWVHRCPFEAKVWGQYLTPDMFPFGEWLDWYPSDAIETRTFQATLFEDLNRDGELSPGEQVLKGIKVCFPGLGDRCVKSDSNGLVTSPGEIRTPIFFKVDGGISPIDGSPFQYVIINNDWIDIPEYQAQTYRNSIGKGYTVPAQRVADATTYEIGSVIMGREGLTQIGIAQTPFIFNESAPIEGGCHVGVFFDLDSRKGYALDWRGNTINTQEWERHLQKNVIYDGHEGTDCDADLGVPVRSVGQGVVTYSGINPCPTSDAVVVSVAYYVGLLSYLIDYGHLDSTAVEEGDPVYPGQVLGHNGKTGSSFPHIHINVRGPINHRTGTGGEHVCPFQTRIWGQYLTPDMFPFGKRLEKNW
jgi:murein DD-endopeptidase MepM/ murein hydrolase activator NlpD